MRTVSLFVLMLVFFGFGVNAQPIFYQHDSSIKVYAWGSQQTLAWCGGFNSTQFTMGDLNHDGLNDLVVYDDWIGVRTFINIGTPGNPSYRYAPEYALNFPPVFGYLILTDYNCDGIPDLFHRGGVGFELYKGYYNSHSQLCFTFYQDLYYNNEIPYYGPYNAYVNPGDIPSIVDVDGDGDLDLISYQITGGTIYYYRNMRVENGLPCDSFVIHLEDKCWGKVYQGFPRTHVLGYNVGCYSGIVLPKKTDSAQKVTHSGNAPCLFDYDMDGDYDYLDGNISFPNMTFLQNGRIPLYPTGPDSMVYQDTMWQSLSGGTTVDLSMFPAAFNIDINQDGKKDLLIAPNTTSENFKCVWYYKNLTTPGSPNWQFQSDSFLVDQSIDVGTGAYPALFDFDKDGKPDLFVGSDGYYQTSGTLISKLSLYRNTSTAGNPSLTFQTRNFLNLDTFHFQGAYPAFGDIDNDGKSDMIIGHTNGTLSYFKNMATSESVTPIWQLAQLLLTDNTGTPITTDGNATPFIYDVDHDGKKDLVIGNVYGQFEYYQNVSTTPGVISLKLVNSALGHVTVDPHTVYGNLSTPFIGKIDSTNVDYLMSGSSSGLIYRFGGIGTGDTTATYAMLDSQYAYIDTQFLFYTHSGTYIAAYDGLRSSLTVGDLAGDGSYEMIVGNVRGGLELYKLKVVHPAGVTTLPNNETGRVFIYPNPAESKLNLSFTGLQEPVIQVTVFDIRGQQVYSGSESSAAGNCSISLNDFQSGVYVCVVQSGVNRYYNKFTVLH